MTATPTIHYVDTTEKLKTFLDLIDGASEVAVDTEFLREKTYRAQLCLIQIAAVDAIGLIDVLAFTDFTPLVNRLFKRKSCEKVFHAIDQDAEVLHQALGVEVESIFDTQVAAAFTGHGEQIGLGALVEILLHVELPKTEGRTDWTHRPLSKSQLVYAADDVRYLLAVKRNLERLLRSDEKIAWVREESNARAQKHRTLMNDDDLYTRVKGHQRIRGVSRNHVKHLAVWRERVASQNNIPRRWVLDDEAVCEFARNPPKDIAAIRQKMRRDVVISDQDVTDALDAIGASALEPKERWPAMLQTRADENETVLVDICLALVKKEASLHDIASSVVASRYDVESLVRGKRSVLESGWRLSIAGEFLRDFLRGAKSLRVVDRALVVDSTDRA